MADFNAIRQEVKSMVGMKFGNYNTSVNALKKGQNYRDFGDGKLIVFGTGNPFIHETNAYSVNGKFSIEDSNTDRTYSCCDDVAEKHSHENMNFTTIMMERGKYQVVIKDNLNDKANKGVIDGNDTVIVYSKDEKPVEKTVKEFLG